MGSHPIHPQWNIVPWWRPVAPAERGGCARVCPGTLGLGLSLVGSFVEVYVGMVSLAEEPPVVPATPATARPRRVLIIDDSPDGAESMMLVLEVEGYEVALAHT